MADNSKIQWVDHTASPWHGCAHGTYIDADGNEQQHPGCLKCYAETGAKRNPGVLGVWGPNGTRVKSASFHANCRRWNKEAEKAGKPATVFPSICDPFEDWQEPILNAKGERFWHMYPPSGAIVTDTGGHADKRPATMDDLRAELFATIDACHWLDFILLTKRPENVRRMWRSVNVQSQSQADDRNERGELYRRNVWLLTSVSDQATADAMIPHMLGCRDLVPVLGVSAEPLIGPVDLMRFLGVWIKPPCQRHSPKFQLECPACNGKNATRVNWIDWVIVGGESGHGARPYDVAWARSIIRQCKEAGVPVFHKQVGSKPYHVEALSREPCSTDTFDRFWSLKDPKGGDMAEWPADLRIRQYPNVKASVTA